MLSQANIDRINRQIESELRSLSCTRSESRREQHFTTIKELKALLDERDPREVDEMTNLVDAVRDLIRMFRR